MNKGIRMLAFLLLMLCVQSAFASGTVRRFACLARAHGCQLPACPSLVCATKLYNRPCLMTSPLLKASSAGRTAPAGAALPPARGLGGHPSKLRSCWTDAHF